MTPAARPSAFRFMSAYVTGKTHKRFLFFLLSGQSDFVCIDNDDKISSVDVWRENRFFLPAQQVGRPHGDAAEHLVLSVNDPPLARYVGGFCGKGFHVSKKEHGNYGRGATMSTR